MCWGDNRYGQLEVPPGQYTAIDTGWGYVCAVTLDGEAACWGSPALGDSGQTQPPPGRYISISASVFRACAVAGGVVCWGDVEYYDHPFQGL